MQSRFDDTGHDGTESHINIDLAIYDEDTSRELTKLNEFVHNQIELGPIPITFRISFSIPGHGIAAQFTYLPYEEDLEYHQAFEKFFDKVKTKSLTEADKQEFDAVFKKHSASIRKRITDEL